MLEEVGQAKDSKLVGHQTRQVVKKLLASQTQKPSGKKRKMVGKKEKAAPSATSMTQSASEADEESDMSSLATKKKNSELLETTETDTEWVKETLKATICGGSGGGLWHHHRRCIPSSS